MSVYNGSPELLIVMGSAATLEQTEHVVARLEEAGAQARVSKGREAHRGPDQARAEHGQPLNHGT